MSECLLAARKLRKSYSDAGQQRAIFSDFDLTIAPGEIVALTGPSGSGKSTLLNLVAGVIAADSGAIELSPATGADARVVAPLRYGQSNAAATAYLRRQYIGYVFQFFNLVPTLTVRENVLLALQLAKAPTLLPEALERLSHMGLDHRLDAFPAELSGGEQQRAAIARALAPRPALVLADEPTGNLDAANAETVVSTLWDAVADCGSALLIATHDLNIAARAHRQVQLA